MKKNTEKCDKEAFGVKLGIIGTRGIPNAYGGFEQFAEFLAKGLADDGFEVYVYNSHSHPYQEKTWNGVNIIHCTDPEDKIGTAGQFIYDLNCILDSRKRGFAVVLFLGYTSSSIWFPLFPKKPTLFTNMDGLEWKRTKYSESVKKFLKFAERLAAKHGGKLISDSVGIKEYLKEEYNRDSFFIPYGAELFNEPDPSVLNKYEVDPWDYNMLIARLEPENSIETILEGVLDSKSSKKMLVIGGVNNAFGQKMKKRFESNKVRFLGGIYDTMDLNNLRYHANIYFHGHTVGGTNPSLLEAMGSQSLICANRNIFNEAVLDQDAFYFVNAKDIEELLAQEISIEVRNGFVRNNFNKIRSEYNWSKIIGSYKKILAK